jgi:hypothetical protein
LKDATTGCIEGIIELFSYYGSLEISVKATDKILYVIGNVVIFKDFINKVMVDFAECIFEI